MYMYLYQLWQRYCTCSWCAHDCKLSCRLTSQCFFFLFEQLTSVRNNGQPDMETLPQQLLHFLLVVVQPEGNRRKWSTCRTTCWTTSRRKWSSWSPYLAIVAIVPEPKSIVHIRQRASPVGPNGSRGEVQRMNILLPPDHLSGPEGSLLTF